MDSDQTKKRTWAEAIQILGGTAGIAFLLSAFVNSYVFSKSWNLNYFQIASTNDVIMNALSWGLALIIIALIALPIAGMIWFMNEWMKVTQYLSESFFDRFPADPEWPSVIRENYEKLGAWFAKDSVTTFWRRSYLTIIFGYAIIQTLAIVTTSPMMDRFKGDPFIYRTGYSVISMPQGAAPCENGAVLWTGERAAVLRCGSDVRVLHGVDGLVTQQANPAIPQT